MELQQVNINGKRIPSCRGTCCSEISRTRTGSWQMLHSVRSAHSEYHWQQRECFTRSISSVAAFSNQHNSCSLSRLSSLYFPQRTRTNSVTFQLQISCSRLFSGSVPPIHLPKSLRGLQSFPQLIFSKKNENDKMFLALSVPHWCRALWLKCSSEPKAWA